nr:MAG TPA: hypothetical protein [Caudoviricetes sp.]
MPSATPLGCFFCCLKNDWHCKDIIFLLYESD